MTIFVSMERQERQPTDEAGATQRTFRLSKLDVSGLNPLPLRSDLTDTPKEGHQTVFEMGWFFYLRSGLHCSWLVFVSYDKLAWSFLLTVEVRFGLWCLRWKSSLLFFAYSSPRPEIEFGRFTYGHRK